MNEYNAMPHMQPLIYRPDQLYIRIKIQRTHPLHHINHPQSTHVTHILHNAREYEHVKTNVTLPTLHTEK